MRTIKKSNLTFCGFDDWCRAVYKTSNGIYLKDITLKGNLDYIPDKLYSSADNTFDGEPNNEYKVIQMKELKDTIPGMTSKDYKERFKAEYEQLCIRHYKLVNMLDKWKEGVLHFTPTCPYELLEKQAKVMSDYKFALEERAKIEGIELSNIFI